VKLLFFGDIVGRAGRAAVAQALPHWRETYQPDLIIGNVENLAHGKGVTEGTLGELVPLGFNAFTTGDHVFHGGHGEQLVADPRFLLVRPGNLEVEAPGHGSLRVPSGTGDVLLMNLCGQVFMHEGYTSPFTAFDRLLDEARAQGPLAGVFVDLHAEATSEKVAFGWHVRGRATAVLGTHTHVPTCDNWVMPGGTAYVSDIGMTGIRESVIGVKTELSLGRFLTGEHIRFEPAKSGTAVVTAMLVSFDPSTAQASSIERLTELVAIA